MKNNPLRENVEKVANFAHVFLYTQATASSILQADWLKNNALLTDFKRNLYNWGNNYSSVDLLDVQNKYGVSREDFETLHNTAKNLAQCLIYPTSEDTPIRKLSLFLYRDQIEEMESLISQLQEIYDGVSEETQNETFLIIRDLGKKNIAKDIIKIPSPYKHIPKATSSLESFINEVKSNAENPSMKSFIFSNQFKLLSTFSTDINDKGLDEEEVQELRSISSVLLIKGFLLNQVTIKLSQKEILKLKEGYLSDSHVTDDEEVQNFSENDNLKYFFGNFNDKIPDLDEEKLNEIYQNHSDDESTPVLKPLVEELMPFYKSLITSSGYAQLTYQVSNKYKNVLVLYLAKSYLESIAPNKLIINPVYINFLPFVVVDPPNEAYNVLLEFFKQCYYNIIYEYGTIYPTRDPKMPYLPEEMDDIDELDTLQNQKYYIINYMVSYLINQNKNIKLSLDDSSLILSMLDWKVDIDCQEGSDMDQYFKELISSILKKYDYSDKYNHLRHFAKYIISTVNNATEPLNTSEMKGKLSSFINQASHGEEPDGSLGCCLIQ